MTLGPALSLLPCPHLELCYLSQDPREEVGREDSRALQGALSFMAGGEGDVPWGSTGLPGVYAPKNLFHNFIHSPPCLKLVGCEIILIISGPHTSLPWKPSPGVSPYQEPPRKITEVIVSPILHSQGIPDHLRRSRAWRSALRVRWLLENPGGNFSPITGLE